MPPRRRGKWNEWSKPTRPTKPKKTITGERTVASIYVYGEYRDVTLTDEQKEAIAGATKVRINGVNFEPGGYGSSPIVEEIGIDFLSNEPMENEHYDRQMEVYNERYEDYKKDMEWWKKGKAKDDARKAKALEEAERKQLEKLKEKYEADTGR